MNRLKVSHYPLVSVIITTYNRPSNLVRAINSVYSQNYPNIEIIVVDDNGKNTKYQLETEEVIGKYLKQTNFQYIVHERNFNASVARNTGFDHSNGDFIALLDDDDEFSPNKISQQVGLLLKSNKEWGGAYCRTRFYINKGRIITTNEEKSGNLSEDILLLKAQFNTSTLLLRREVYKELNGFDETFYRHQDWEFMIRFFRKHKLLLVPDILVDRHREDGCFGPVGMKALLYRLKYLRTFKEDIELLSSKNDIYYVQYHSLIVGLLLQKKYYVAKCVLNRAKKYKSISLRNYLVYIKHFILGLLNQ